MSSLCRCLDAADLIGCASVLEGEALESADIVALSVVFHLIRLCGDGDLLGNGPVSDGESSFGLGDVIVVRRNSLRQLVCECVGAFARDELASLDLVCRLFARCPAVSGDSDLIRRQSRTVIFLGCGCAGESHIPREDGQAAADFVHGELSGDVFSGRILHHGFALDGDLLDGVCHAGAAGLRLQALHGVGHAIHLEGESLESRDGMLASVIAECSGGSLHRDLILIDTVCDLQDSLGGADLIVSGQSSFLQNVGEGIGTGPRIELASGNVVLGALISNESVAGDCDICRRQGCSIVFLAGGCTGQDYLSGLNLQASGLGGNCELTGNIHSGGVTDDGLAGDGYRRNGAVHVDGLAVAFQSFYGIVSSVYVKLQGLESADGVLLSVIQEFPAGSFYGDLKGLAAVCDGQRPFFCRDLIVVRAGSRLQVIAEVVFRGARVGTVSMEGVGCSFTLHKAIPADGDIFAGQRSAVVFSFGRTAGQSHGALSDDQLTVLQGDGELICDVSALGILHQRCSGDGDRIGSGIDPGALCLQTGYGVFVSIHGECGLLQAACTLLSAVVQCLGAVCGDFDLVFRTSWGHVQCTLAGGDIIILGPGSFLQLVCEGIGGGSHSLLRSGDGIIRALALGKSVAAGLYLRCGQGLAVVFLLCGCTGEGHCSRQDLQAALCDLHGKLFGHVISIGVGDLRLAGDGRLHGAGMGPFCLSLDSGNGVNDLVVGEIGAVESADGVLAAVVLHLIGIGGQSDLSGVTVCDLQDAFLCGDDIVALLHSCRKLIGELVLHASRKEDGAGHGDLRLLALHESVAAGDNVGYGECMSVIGFDSRAAGEGDLSGPDGEASRGQRHVELSGDVLALLILHHRCSSDLHGFHGVRRRGSAGGGIDSLYRVFHSVHIKLQAGEAADCVLLPVIQEGPAVSDNGDGELLLPVGDRQSSFLLCDLIVVFFDSRVHLIAEVVFGDPGVGPVAVGLEGCAFSCHESVSAHGDALCLQRRSVVFLLSGGTFHGQIPRLDLQAAAGLDHLELGRDIHALGISYHCGTLDGDLAGRLGYVCSCGGSLQSFYGVGQAIHLEGELLESGYHMLLSVIEEGSALSLDLQAVLILAVSYSQGSGLAGDVIVLCQGSLVQSIGKGILAAARVDSAAGNGEACSLALGEASLADGDLAVSQRSAVEFLLSGGTGQGDCALSDGEGSLLQGDGKLLGHVASVLVGDGGRSADVDIISSRMGPCANSAESAYGIGVSTDLECVLFDPGDGLLGAVIGFASGIGLYGDLVFRIPVQHVQGTLGLGDLIIIGQGPAVQAVFKFIGRGTRSLLASGHLIFCSFALGKSVAGYGDSAVGQSLTVVFLLRGSAGEGQRSGLDHQLSRCDGDGELTGDVISFGIQYFRGSLRGGLLCAGMGGRSFRRDALYGIGHAIVPECLGQEPRDGVLLSVVLDGQGLGGQGDLMGSLAALYLQGAFLRGDVIVAGLGAILQVVGEGVLAGSRDGLGPGDAEGGAFPCHKAISAGLNAVACEGQAVVFLLTGAAGQGDGALSDGEFSVVICDLKHGAVGGCEHSRRPVCKGQLVCSGVSAASADPDLSQLAGGELLSFRKAGVILTALEGSIVFHRCILRGQGHLLVREEPCRKGGVGVFSVLLGILIDDGTAQSLLAADLASACVPSVKVVFRSALQACGGACRRRILGCGLGGHADRALILGICGVGDHRIPDEFGSVGGVLILDAVGIIRIFIIVQSL